MLNVELTIRLRRKQVLHNLRNIVILTMLFSVIPSLSFAQSVTISAPAPNAIYTISQTISIQASASNIPNFCYMKAFLVIGSSGNPQLGSRSDQDADPANPYSLNTTWTPTTSYVGNYPVRVSAYKTSTTCTDNNPNAYSIVATAEVSITIRVPTPTPTPTPTLTPTPTPTRTPTPTPTPTRTPTPMPNTITPTPTPTIVITITPTPTPTGTPTPTRTPVPQAKNYPIIFIHGHSPSDESQNSWVDVIQSKFVGQNGYIAFLFHLWNKYVILPMSIHFVTEVN